MTTIDLQLIRRLHYYTCYIVSVSTFSSTAPHAHTCMTSLSVLRNFSACQDESAGGRLVQDGESGIPHHFSDQEEVGDLMELSIL